MSGEEAHTDSQTESSLSEPEEEEVVLGPAPRAGLEVLDPVPRAGLEALGPAARATALGPAPRVAAHAPPALHRLVDASTQVTPAALANGPCCCAPHAMPGHGASHGASWAQPWWLQPPPPETTTLGWLLATPPTRWGAAHGVPAHLRALVQPYPWGASVGAASAALEALAASSAATTAPSSTTGVSTMSGPSFVATESPPPGRATRVSRSPLLASEEGLLRLLQQPPDEQPAHAPSTQLLLEHPAVARALERYAAAAAVEERLHLRELEELRALRVRLQGAGSSPSDSPWPR